MALTERLALLITANAGEAVREFDHLGARLTGVDGLARKTATSGGLVGKAFTGAALVGAAALVEMVKKGTEALIDQQRIDAQTKAALASTGGAAGVTASQVGQLGEELSHYSAYSIEAVKQTENLLLTFTAIKNQTGEGNDVFSQTTKAVLDMSTALGEDLHDASIQVGKALNNPIVGLTALRRVGVTFDEQQVKTITHLTQTGHLLEAQKLILAELNKEFGDSAEAAGKTAAGGFAQLRNSVTELDKALAGPILQPITTALHDVVTVVREINAHPLAARAFGDLTGIAAGAFLVSKGLKVLQAIRDSELATSIRGTVARTAETDALNAEAAAATRATTAVEGLNAAEAAGVETSAARGGASGAATRGGLLGSAVLGPVAVGAVVGEVGSHLLNNGKGVEDIPAMLRAHALGEQLNDAIARYRKDEFTFGQNAALEGLSVEVNSARTKAAKGDYSELSKAVEDVNRAIADNASVFDAATYAANQHTASLRVNAAAAADNLKAWQSGAEDRRKAIAAEAAQFDIFSDSPGAKLAGKAGVASAAAETASHSLDLARQAVARAEERLQRVRSTGKATAQQLASAEDALASAKDRAARASARAASAQDKANTASHLARGLTTKDLLGRERTNLRYSESLAADAGKLVAAGLSPAVLQQLQATEKQFPGTIHNLVGHLTRSVVSEMNAAQGRTQKAQETYLGMDEAATGRLVALAKRQADAILAAYQATLDKHPVHVVIQGPGLVPGVLPAPRRPPVQGPGLVPNVLPYPSRTAPKTYNFYGPIQGVTMEQALAFAERHERIANL